MSGLHPLRTARAPLAFALVALSGCPQLLQDDFSALSGQDRDPDAAVAGNGGGGAASSDPGAGGGNSGAGGAVSAGSGGDGGSGDAGSSNPDPGDASTPGSGGTGFDAGSTEPDAGQTEPQTPLGTLVEHRYSFDAGGSAIIDSVGNADGTAIGASVVAGAGKIALSGNNQYVDLPDGMVSGFDNATIEAWVNWTANPSLTTANWQTLFSFGTNAAGEDAQGEATTYIYFTPKSGNSNEVRGGFSLTGFDNEVYADGDVVLPASQNPAVGTHVAVVFDAALGRVSLYVQGSLVPADPPGTGTINLRAINDVNNWIGRSQFPNDPEFQGEILEFRIYGAALSASDLALSFGLGPDAQL